MAKGQLKRQLVVAVLVVFLANAAWAVSLRAQSHRVHEGRQAGEAAAAASADGSSSSSRPEVPSSPAVAMNPPADDQDDGSNQAPAPSTQPRLVQLPQLAPAAAAAAAAARQADAAADAQQPAVPQMELELGNNQQPSPASNSNHEAAMFWSPQDAWSSWGGTAAASEQQSGAEPTSYSIQVSSFSSGDSPQQVVISGSVNGKPLDAAVAGMLGGSSSHGDSSSSRRPTFKPQTLADITDTLGSFGLSVDWGHEDAWRLVQSVEQQVAQQMTSVQGVFDSMLADATDGLVQLESLANGGLIDWHQRMLGLGGGWSRKLKSTGSSSSSSSSTGSHGQLDVLRLLTSRPNSQQ